MGFTAAKRGAQLQHPIATLASQDGQDIGQDATQFGGKIGRLKEGMSVTVDRAHAAITLHHFAEVSSIGIHRELTLDNINMWCDYPVPGQQFYSACMSMCRHDSYPFLFKILFSPTKSYQPS